MVEVKTAPELPTIWADHDRLEQVFVNLLANALAHNPPGTRVMVTAEATAASAGGTATVTVRVSDDGRGMPPELLHAPAIAAAARRPRKRGESGPAWACRSPRESWRRTGAPWSWNGRPGAPSFRITLPVERPAEKPRRRRRAMTTASKQPVPTKVLIVEDDPNIVDLIRSNLAVRGFDTVVCAGSKVLTLLDTEQPDMVLLDLMLPEADGFELCRQIRERSPVAIIVVSARGGERDKVTALNMGADDYMTKPFGIEELLARILATLRRTRPATEARPRRRPTVITIGDLRIDLASQQVRLRWRGGAPHPHRIRAAARARRQPGKAAVPHPPAPPGLGPRVRDGDRVRPRVHPPAARQAGATGKPHR